MRGLDPRIHPFRKDVSQSDGLLGQARRWGEVIMTEAMLQHCEFFVERTRMRRKRAVSIR
jgi:hypothetical protein